MALDTVLLCRVSFTLSDIYAVCHKEAVYAECHYAECSYAECFGTAKREFVRKKLKLRAILLCSDKQSESWSNCH